MQSLSSLILTFSTTKNLKMLLSSAHINKHLKKLAVKNSSEVRDYFLADDKLYYDVAGTCYLGNYRLVTSNTSRFRLPILPKRFRFFRKLVRLTLLRSYESRTLTPIRLAFKATKLMFGEKLVTTPKGVKVVFQSQLKSNVSYSLTKFRNSLLNRLRRFYSSTYNHLWSSSSTSSNSNTLDLSRLHTKLKYSRSPAYDIVSGGVAVLFAGLLGFLVSEKFGIELVDSGDFYYIWMYGVFAVFSLKPLVAAFTSYTPRKEDKGTYEPLSRDFGYVLKWTHTVNFISDSISAIITVSRSLMSWRYSTTQPVSILNDETNETMEEKYEKILKKAKK